MRFISLLLLTFISIPAVETPIALWGEGPGTLSGKPAATQAPIDTNQIVTAGDRPVRLELLGFPGSDVMLQAGAVVRFSIVSVEGKNQLLIDLDHGAIQVDVTGTGPWSGLIVRGGAVEAHVTGTLFVVERTEQKGDFVALVHGHLNVRLRREVVAALGADQSADLTSRQGIGGGAAGLSGLVILNSRPQITSSKSIVAQSTDASEGDGGWTSDDAGTLTGDIPDGDLITVLPVDLIGPDLVNDELMNDVVNAVIDDLPQAALNQLTGPQGPVSDIVNTQGTGVAFGLPPAVP